MNTKSPDVLNWSTLMVPIALGIVAGFLYYNSLASQLNKEAFAVLLVDAAAGTPMSRDMFGPAYLSGDTDKMHRDGIRWRDVAVVEGFSAARQLKANTFIVGNDLNKDTSEPGEAEKREKFKLDIKYDNDDIQVDNLIRSTVRHEGVYKEIGPFRVLKVHRRDRRVPVEIDIATKPFGSNEYDPEFVKLLDAVENRNGYELVEISLASVSP